MPQILIVDDSRTSRKMLKNIISGLNYDIVEASNGQEGYIKYKEEKPDVVLLDITMPVMDGIETLQLIKKEDEDARVVMVSAAGQKDKILKAIKCGASNFISKPYETEDIIKILTEILGETI